MSAIESYKCDECGKIREKTDPEMFLINGDIWRGSVSDNDFMAVITSGSKPLHYCKFCLGNILGIKQTATRTGILV